MFGLFRGKEKGTGQNDPHGGDLLLLPTASSSNLSSTCKMNPFEEYGLSSPPKGTHARSIKEAKKAMNSDGYGRLLSRKKRGSERTKMLLFLYGRGFMCDSPKDKRKQHLEAMTNDAAKQGSPGAKQYSPGAKQRLLHVIAAEGDRNITASHQEMYTNNMLILRQYFKQDGAIGFLPDMSKAVFYFRCQKQGNCFLQAPAVMMSYLAQKNAIKGITAPVDVSKFVRRSFTDRQLYDYIVEDGGGSSETILKGIIRSLTEESFSGITGAGRALVDDSYPFEVYVNRYGPGLVHRFKVSKNFEAAGMAKGQTLGYFQFSGDKGTKGKFVEVKKTDKDKEAVEMELSSYLESIKELELPCPRALYGKGSSSFAKIDKGSDGTEGEHAEATHELHAMVLIGGRIDKETKKKWFLLQNWWTNMQLIEVSAEYFQACDGLLTFVEDKGKLQGLAEASVDRVYEMNGSRVAESNNLDRPDSGRSWERALFCENERSLKYM